MLLYTKAGTAADTTDTTAMTMTPDTQSSRHAPEATLWRDLRDPIAKAKAENFPVVTRLVPRAVRQDLMAVYAFARLVDDIGDEYAGDRLAALEWLERDLRAAIDGQPSHPVTARLARTIATTSLTEAPFLDLIAANRRDQTLHQQDSWDDLLDYCRLSANPIGAAVLAIAGADTPERRRLADRVCSGLQIIEHLQDVGEDAAAGRVYLPAEDLACFGVEVSDLLAARASTGLRAVVAFELTRARELLAAGEPLVRSLHGWPRLAVAGYVAGGMATADAIEAAGYDVLHNAPVRPERARTVRHAVALAARRSGERIERGPATDLEQAYAACRDITRQQAKNFAYGIALLPRPKRRAMTVVYALARRIDDIVDEPGDHDAKARQLDELQHLVHRTATEDTAADRNDPVLVGLADVLRHYPLPLDAIDDLFAGCRRDLAGATYTTLDDLITYCRQVAGSVGRLSLAIFGTERPEITAPMADSLGVALQLTNVLRDLLEDRDLLERVYLPADDLARFGCAPDASGPPERLTALVIFEAERARAWYREGLQLLPHLDRRSRACVAAMAGIYHRLLDRIEHDPAAVLSGRVSLTGFQKLAVAAQGLTSTRTAA
jgi:15-cis-phytoene synthase